VWAMAFLLSSGTALAEDELPEDLLMGPEGTRPVYEDDGRMWWVGWQASLTRDQMTGEQPINYDWGLAFSVPMMMDLYKGLGTRMKLSVTYSGEPPLDEAVVPFSYVIPAEESGQQPQTIDKVLPGFFGALQLNTGVSYTHGLLEGTVNPYVGFGPSLMLVMCFPDLEEVDAVLLENPDEDDSGISSIDPYTVNVALGVDAYFGVNFALGRTLYLNVEAEYTQAKINETGLEKAKAGYYTSRPEFTYGVMALSTGLTWHF